LRKSGSLSRLDPDLIQIWPYCDGDSRAQPV
jgi:hypothetical protein